MALELGTPTLDLDICARCGYDLAGPYGKTMDGGQDDLCDACQDAIDRANFRQPSRQPKQPEPEPPATGLDRNALIASAGDLGYLASRTMLGRTSTILSNMMHAASEARDWHAAAACRWLLGRMTVRGLHSTKRSQKAVAAQVARLADAVLARAKIEAAAEAEALAQASAQTHALTLYDAAAWLETGALVELSPAEMAEVVAAFHPFPEPEPPEPTSPAQAPIPQEPEEEQEEQEAIGLAQFYRWSDAMEAARYEQEQAFWRDYDAHRDAIAMEAACRLDALAMGLDVLEDDLMDWMESDETAAWEHGLVA